MVMEAVAGRLEAIASRLEAVASRLEAIAWGEKQKVSTGLPLHTPISSFHGPRLECLRT